MAITKAQQAKKFEMQGKVRNYLGKQKMVKAPKKWKSGPNHPDTELAYITKAEKDALVNMNMYGSMNGKANKGPSGIISLNGWGDSDRGTSDASYGGGNVSGSGDNRDYGGGAEAEARSARASATQEATRVAAVAEENARVKEKERIDKILNDSNYHGRSKFQKMFEKGISTLTRGNLKAFEDWRKKQERADQTITNLQLGNRGSDVPSQFFGVTFNPANTVDKEGNFPGSDPEVGPTYTDAALSNYKNVTGSFPTVYPDNNEDNDTPYIIPPVYVPPVSADTAATDEDDPFTPQFTRASLTDADIARINQIGATRAANGGRIGYNMGGMDEENLQAGAPDLRLEGNQIPQQEEMASMPNIDAELYQLFLDALRKGDVPQGTTFDAYKQLMMQMMSEQQGGQMQQPQMAQQQMPPEMMQEQEMQPQRETAAFGGIMGLDGRRSYGWGSIGNIFKKAARAVKKVAKSPIGKAALIYAGGSYLSGAGLFGSLKGAGALSSFVPSFGPKSSIAKFMLKDPKSGFSLANLLGKGLSNKGVFAGITGLSALAGLYTKKTEDDEESLDDLIGRSVRGPSLDPSGIRKQIAANKGNIDPNEYAFLQSNYYAADGGRINKAEGGLMDLGGNEMDLRAEGGFVPIGGKEKADDVPARLSKNEFVFTADAVKGAGQGDIDKGSEVMYNIMKNLEAGGNISEESQGSNGAREMFQTSQRLGEVV